MRKRILSLLLAAVMVLSVFPLAGMHSLFTTAEATKVKDLPTNDLIRFGSYPQERVTDANLLTKLNAAIGNFDTNSNLKTYNYCVGNNSEGSAARVTGMIKYIDFRYEKELYRAVKLTQWRPRTTDQQPNTNYSSQDDSGYSLNQVYFFRYVELYWEILDKNEGLLVCDSVIDAQAFTEKYNIINNRYVCAVAEYPGMYANAFMISDINTFLNKDFYNVAFDKEQQKRLGTVAISDTDGEGNDDYTGLYYGYPGLSYSVGLLSVQDLTAYKGKFSMQTQSTDYAKCVGIGVNEGGTSYWLSSRSQSMPGNGNFSKQSFFFKWDGKGTDKATVNNVLGVRPVIKISGDLDLTEVEVKFTSTPSTGTTPSNIVDKPIAFSDKHYTVHSIEWKTGSGAYSNTVPTMASNTTYTMRVHLSADTGWLFSKDLKVKTTGTTLKAKTVSANGTDALIEYEIKIPADQPTYGFSVGWAIPKLGQKLEHQAANPSYSSGPSSGVNAFNVTEKWTKNGTVVSPGTTLSAGTYTVEVNYSVKPGYYMVDNFILNERVKSYWEPDGDITLTFDVSKGTAKATASYTISDKVNYLNLVIPQDPLPGHEVSTYATPSAKDAAGNWIAGNDRIVKVDGFWYEGKNVLNPTEEQKLVAGKDKFQKGKTYTYRFAVSLNSGYSWGSNPVFKLNGTEKSPSWSTGVLGGYLVEFTYEGLTDRITSVSLANVMRPANGAGFRTDPAVTSRNQNSYYVNLTKGWYDKPEGSIVSTPQVGETYYMMITLGAQEGYSFSRSDVTLDLYEKDWNTKITFTDKTYKTMTRSWDNDTAIIYVGIKCEEIHVLKNSLQDIDSPQIGKKLDTDVKLVTGMASLAFISYFINGEKVMDPDLKPSTGDVVDIYVGLKTLGGAVFDDGVYLTWVFDGDSVNSRRSYREYMAGVPDDIAVFTQRFTMPYSSVPEAVTKLNFTNSTQPANGTKATSSVSAMELDKIQLVNNGEWMYDLGDGKIGQMDTSESFKTGTSYALAVKFKMRAGFTLADNCKITLTDKNGTPVDYDRAELKKDGDTYTAWFYVTGIAKTPKKTINTITLNNVTQPVVGKQIGDQKVGTDELAFENVDIPEPEKYYISGYRGSYWYEAPDYDTLKEIKFGGTFKEGTSYALKFKITVRNGYQLADSPSILLLDDNGIEVNYNGCVSGAVNANGEAEFKIFFPAPIKDAPTEETYYVDVKNGTSTPAGEQPAGTKITVTADAAPAGKEFYRWVVEKGGVTVDNITKATASFTLRNEDVVISATYRDKAAATHSVKVTSGTASPAAAAKGATVTVTAAAAPEGQTFDKWEVVKGGVTLKDASAAATTFTMGDADVELKATYKAKSEGEKYTLGDVDADGQIKSGDARLALRAAVKLETFWNQKDSAKYKAANVDKDDKISANDARMILRASVKLEDPKKW